MKRNLFFTLILVSTLYNCKSSKPNTSANKTSEPVIQTIGGKPVYASEFTYVYNKNNANSKDAYTSESIKEYLNLYTNFKLKVREAEELGLDTTQSFKSELEGYKKQLAQPYMTEKGVTEQLTKEAYERMKEEVNASHILITVAPDASPKDTLEAFKKISEIRQKALSGGSFEALAEEFSQDPSAKSNKGNLGYFTSLQMVYPFEDAAYKTKVGEVSQPVRTRFGYHIIKVKNRRPSQGQVKVAHIMVRTTAGMPEGDSLAAKQKIDEIYSRLEKGEEWNKIVDQFSDDVNSKSKGGELPWFSTGRMIPSFEEAAFSLKNTGDYSKPVNSPYGWHIIKLLEKKPLESFSELEASLKGKVTKDSRSELNRIELIKRLKRENQFVENTSALSSAVQKADSTLLNGSWNKKVDEKNNAVLFSIKEKKYTINDFFAYLPSFIKGRVNPNTSPEQVMRNAYKTYSEEELVKYEEAHLEDKYVDYKMLVKEYRDGILLFQLMDEKVWSKAIADTVGLKDFFAKNREKYKWDTRAHAAIFSVPNEQVLQKVKQELKSDKFPVKNKNYDNINFASGKVELSDDAKRSLDNLSAELKHDKNLILEVALATGAKESAAKGVDLQSQRGKEVRSYLKEKGVDSSKVIIKTQPKATSKKSDKNVKGGQASFSFYSKSPKALESTFNEAAPLTLQVTEGVYQKGENDVLSMVDWKEGESTTKKNDRVYYVVISKIDEPRLKTFEEARGLVISDYQTYLEQEWIKSLKNKYPVSVNESEVQKLMKQQ